LRLPPVNDAASQGKSATNLATTRIFLVLKKFIGATSSLGVTELATELGMTKNMVHRALATLLDVGYLVRDRSGKRFEIGPGVLELLGNEAEQTDLRNICHPYLLRLHKATGESVFLSIIVGRHRVNIDSVEAQGRPTWRGPWCSR
jgi:IclR family acetate operon transcriptional repressor